MTEQEIRIRERMDLAAKEDRERFFKVADTLYFQSKYQDKLTELEELKQWWRDITRLLDYPNIDFPPPLPNWFPKVNFASCWEKDIYIEQELKRHEEMQKLNKNPKEANIIEET